MLYPIKFKPIYKEKIWGGSKINSILGHCDAPKSFCGEVWGLSAVDGNVSIVSNGYYQGCSLNDIVSNLKSQLLGSFIFDRYSSQFPILIKFIDATDDLSIQVHPNDELAMKRHNSLGKTELWYVVDADDGAKLISGFSSIVAPNEFRDMATRGNLLDCLNSVPVFVGDAYFIHPGRIHAIGKGILLAEIQQTSDITYRVYDYNRPDQYGKFRDLHLDLALDVIDFNSLENGNVDYSFCSGSIKQLVKCEYFTVNLLDFCTYLERDFTDLDCFVIYVCTEGFLEIECDNGSKEVVGIGETILIPAVIKHLKFSAKTSVKLLEVYIEQVLV